LGHSEEDMELPEGSTLADLLRRLADRRRDAETHLLTPEREPRPSLLIVVNDAAVSAREAATVQLNPGDIVTLLPPIAGG
jgi:sulfur carrier protein ThiS